MNYRLLHKAKLKELLQNIQIKGKNIHVIDTAFTNSDFYPYCAISSGELTPNRTQGSKLDTNTYNRVYTYDISVVFDFADEYQTTQDMQNDIDLWEAELIDTFQSEVTRNAGGGDYHDLRIVNISAPIDGVEFNLREGLLFKVFTIELDVIVGD